MASGNEDWTIKTTVPNSWKTMKGSVGSTWTNVTLPVIPVSISIINTHATQTLSVRSSAAEEENNLVPGESIGIDSGKKTFQVYGSGAGTTYEILYTYNA